MKPSRILPTCRLAVLAGLAVACSSSTDAGPDLTAGTFQVTIPRFALATPGPCDVAPFQFTVDKLGSGQLQPTVPQMTFTCVNAVGTFDLDPAEFNTIGDTVEMVFTDTLLTPNPVFTMRWRPGSTNLTGPAIFDLGAVGADTVTWTGVRQ